MQLTVSQRKRADSGSVTENPQRAEQEKQRKNDQVAEEMEDYLKHRSIYEEI